MSGRGIGGNKERKEEGKEGINDKGIEGRKV